MRRRARICILDYGSGNHASIVHSLNSLGFICNISNRSEEVKKSDLIILPGVGAFGPAMTTIRERGLDDVIRQWSADARPILGICLGMQLLGQISFEGGPHRGLGLIQMSVDMLGREPCWHIGWNSIQVQKADSIFADFADNDFYFNHSYAFAKVAEESICTTFFRRNFASVVRHGMVVGVQFHPEKSQEPGQVLMDKIVKELTGYA